MALSDYKLTSFTNPISSLDDKPQMSATDLKARFDANSEELKTKVNGLIDELTDEMGDKVDAVSGKGLSTNDYTTTEKEKLADIDVSKQHTHGNKSVLDAITAIPVPTITWEEMDTFYSGTAAVTRTNTPAVVDSDVKYFKGYFLTVHSEYLTFNGNQDGAYDYYQSLLCPDGKVLTRNKPYTSAAWSDWKEYGHTITPAIAEETDNIYTTTFTLYAGYRYKLARTTTTSKTLNFTAPTDKTAANEIEIYMTVSANESVLWGSNILFVNSEIPTLVTGKYYRVIAEFDPLADKWCVGVIESGASA